MRTFTLRDRSLETELPAFIMGIVNCTDDSFFAPSRGGAEQALRLADEGADIIDVGGESTRPGASYVDEAEEISRIVPVIEEIRRVSGVPISVDTRKASVMRAAFEAGADMVNDVSALEDDGELASFAAEKGLPVILMHKRGTPGNMQKRTDYGDVFREVDEYLCRRADHALSKGIRADRIIVDPGVGFGKDTAANLELISRCGSLCGGRFPVLMALSRKTVIGNVTGRPVGERLFGTVAADLVAVQSGASFVRVHDVAACRDSLAMLGALARYGTQGGGSSK